MAAHVDVGELAIGGEDHWIPEATEDGTLIAVTDGSYMKDLYPNIHSAALVLECTNGRGRLWFSFPEASEMACSYRGKLVGLMAIHLILLSMNKVQPNLKGTVHIFSDVLGALNKVKDLPPSQIPSSWAHSDVLKNTLVNCAELSFTRLYSHVRAHQDDKTVYQDRSRPSQLNCSMDFNAKRVLLDTQPMNKPRQHAFPLEPVCAFAGPTKLTADTGKHLWYWAHRSLVKEHFYQLDIMYSQQFELVDWEMVHWQLNSIPKLFQLWACKQIMRIAGTMEWDKTVIQKCPSCMQEQDTCAHVLHCCHEGRVETLHYTIDLMVVWMKEVDMDPDLLDCIAEYAYAQGGRAMMEICNGLGETCLQMA